MLQLLAIPIPSGRPPQCQILYIDSWSSHGFFEGLNRREILCH